MFYQHSPSFGLYLKYTACDMFLLLQVYYYRLKRRRALRGFPTEMDGCPSENSRLLGNDETTHRVNRLLVTEKVALRYTILTVLVTIAGVTAHLISNWLFGGTQSPEFLQPVDREEWKVQTLGWMSAVAYRESLGALSIS